MADQNDRDNSGKTGEVRQVNPDNAATDPAVESWAWFPDVQ